MEESMVQTVSLGRTGHDEDSSVANISQFPFKSSSASQNGGVFKREDEGKQAMVG